MTLRGTKVSIEARRATIRLPLETLLLGQGRRMKSSGQ